MSAAFLCQTCDGTPTWRLTRRGDVAVSWACDPHLAAVATGMQRPFEVTELVIALVAKLRARSDRVLDAAGGERW